MQTNYINPARPPLAEEDLSPEDVLRRTAENLADPDVADFKVWPNRHERRTHVKQMRQNANRTKSDKAHSRRKRR